MMIGTTFAGSTMNCTSSRYLRTRYRQARPTWIGGCDGKVRVRTAVGGAVTGSSRGRIGKTIVGTGFDGSFVPCAKAASKKPATQKPIIKNSVDERMVSPSSSDQLDLWDQVPADVPALPEPAMIN